MDLKGKRVLITGASSGIGKAATLALAEKKAELFLVARRKDRLDELVSSIGAKTLVQDLTHENAVHNILDFTNNKVDVLINNAGIALGKDSIENSSWSDLQSMLTLNIDATFKLTQALVPLMLNNGGGDIINLCSVAGHWTYQGGAVYCASKHALWAFTKTLREETCGRNLRVMQISPGMIETEFSVVRFKGDTKQAEQTYKGMTPLKAEDIARQILFMLEQPRHVCIDEILSMPTDQGSPTTVFRR